MKELLVLAVGGAPNLALLTAAGGGAKGPLEDEFNTSDYEDEMVNTKLKFSDSSLEKSDSDQYYCTPENKSQALLVTCSLFTTTPSLSLFSVYPPHVCNPYFPLSEQRISNKYCQESGGQDNYLGHGYAQSTQHLSSVGSMSTYRVKGSRLAGTMQHIHRWYIGLGGRRLRSSSSGDTSKSSMLKVSVNSCLPSLIRDSGKKKCTRICVEGEWKTILEKNLSTPDQDSNLDFSVICYLVYCDSSILDQFAIEAGRANHPQSQSKWHALMLPEGEHESRFQHVPTNWSNCVGFGTSMPPTRVNEVVPNPLYKRIGGTGKSVAEGLHQSLEVVLDGRHIQVTMQSLIPDIPRCAHNDPDTCSGMPASSSYTYPPDGPKQDTHMLSPGQFGVQRKSQVLNTVRPSDLFSEQPKWGRPVELYFSCEEHCCALLRVNTYPPAVRDAFPTVVSTKATIAHVFPHQWEDPFYLIGQGQAAAEGIKHEQFCLDSLSFHHSYLPPRLMLPELHPTAHRNTRAAGTPSLYLSTLPICLSSSPAIPRDGLHPPLRQSPLTEDPEEKHHQETALRIDATIIGGQFLDQFVYRELRIPPQQFIYKGVYVGVFFCIRNGHFIVHRAHIDPRIICNMRMTNKSLSEAILVQLALDGARLDRDISEFKGWLAGAPIMVNVEISNGCQGLQSVGGREKFSTSCCPMEQSPFRERFLWCRWESNPGPLDPVGRGANHWSSREVIIYLCEFGHSEMQRDDRLGTLRGEVVTILVSGSAQHLLQDEGLPTRYL
uniref:Uncharacterized protein n=1 Tax=Timema poppense TaxID=170557 RepID=A0A7R9GW29_TIMPO|nr:unnamed protein product [Timema poppensis]